MSQFKMLDAQRVADLLRIALSDSDKEPVRVFWYEVEGNRETFTQELRDAVKGKWIFAVPLRTRGFDSPNAISGDLLELVERNKDAILEDSEKCPPGPDSIGIVVLARGSLQVPQAASPVTLPSWFPAFGGELTTFLIQDLCTTALVSCNAPELRIHEISRLLFSIEGVLLECMRSNRLANRHSGGALLQSLRDRGMEPDNLEEFLDQAVAARSKVSDPATYRPSARTADSLVAWVMRYVGAETPERVHRGAGALSEAIGGQPKGSGTGPPPLFTLVLRPTQPPPEDVAWFRELLLTVYSASQLTTAAAHADSYPLYPVQHLRALSHEIRQWLSDALGDLERHLSWLKTTHHTGPRSEGS